jgi:hypothetical protein
VPGIPTSSTSATSEGWHIDAATKADIDAILKRSIVDPVSPAFMAPPLIRSKERKRLAA